MMRVYTHYKEWEDYKAGLYALTCENENELTQKSVRLLANPVSFFIAMESMLIEWPVACMVNLTDTSQNRQAWLGQAACCYNHSAPDYVTKKAWWLLTDDEREIANATAQKIIDRHDKGIDNAETLFA